jgi:hypothetical protein
LRNVTICPPKAAGFGENERAPLLLVMVMVAGPVPVGDGPVGPADPPPPPQLHALRTARIADAAVRVPGRMVPAFHRTVA